MRVFFKFFAVLVVVFGAVAYLFASTYTRSYPEEARDIYL